MARELPLKYGCNPNQTPARLFMKEGDLPLTILSGNPGYINFLDALNGYQLVKELQTATGFVAATSFKHVSPTGAAIGLPLSQTLIKSYFVEDFSLPLSPLANAYVRARGADRISSYGDFIALSDICDEVTALLIKHEISDGIIAPGYTDKALNILRSKRNGNYTIMQIDPSYQPTSIEQKDCYGITFEQHRNDYLINATIFDQITIPTTHTQLTDDQKRDLMLALIVLKYTQSNSVCYALDGQAIGIGAGQQSRIHCTRLAGNKADRWFLRQHPQVLSLPFLKNISRADRDNAIDVYLSSDYTDVTAEGIWESLFTTQPEPLTPSQQKAFLSTLSSVCLASDAFFPFGDNILRAARSGVSAIIQPGGSIRDDDVIGRCNEFGILMAFTGMRLFHH